MGCWRIGRIEMGGNSIAFGSAPRREADSQPISQLARPAVSQTETHSQGCCQWQTRLQAVGRKVILQASSGRMVMQPTAGFLVGSLNPGRANMAAALPTTVHQLGFEPLT